MGPTEVRGRAVLEVALALLVAGCSSPSGVEASRGSSNLTRENRASCFDAADALAEQLEASLLCAEDGECKHVMAPTLVCMRPDLHDLDACLAYLAAGVALSSDEVRSADDSLRTCLFEGVTREDVWEVRVEGRDCSGAGCASEPVVACVDGRCEVVPLR